MAIAGGGLFGCAAGDEQLEVSSLDKTLVCYRGELREAEEVDGVMYVEGDLEVTDAESFCNSVEERDLSGRRAPAGEGTVWDPSVYGVKWPNGRVPFEISSSFTQSQEEEIRAAMTEWTAVAPGVQFVERTVSDASYIDFVTNSSNKCSSGYGSLANDVRTVRYSNRCFGSYTIHHEIGHALGLQHEHTRPDRDDYVVVSSTSDNYMIDDGASMFDYDFDSVMHYPLSSALSLAPGVVLPEGVQPGQTDHLSNLDIASVRAMYPELRLNASAFVSAGNPVQLCRLAGREQDAATKYRLVSTGGAATFTFDGNFSVFDESIFESAGIVEYPRECGARSNFWASNYDYPNNDQNQYGSPNSVNEQFEVQGEVVLMTAGLIPVLL